ncbi:MAG: mechanosensitive ion channel family protein [Rhodobacterales bacterium]|jgi:small-conductance mechanosensitive channel|uniref:mechanosensitive ion channel family protein n=1 Tax=uncultured Planktomarina sp. TaxID=1538529 RepID=UPI0032613AEA|tara:strand:+ start:2617 stop:3960 length:1344 start_codon:yes stop_codon:yes gene_type:complete
MLHNSPSPAASDTPQNSQDIALSLLDQGHNFLLGLLRPWNAYQVAIALGIFIIATILAWWLGPRFHEWIRNREGWPIWRKRVMLMVHRRLRLMIFVILTYVVVWALREITWPSRSYLLGGIGQLAFVWYIIATSTRLITNSFTRKMVRYVGWTWGTVSVLNMTDIMRSLLDSAAIQFGDTRISVWLLVQAAVTLAALLVSARLIAKTGADRLRRNEDLSPSVQVLAIKFIQVALYSTAFFLGLRSVGFDLTGLAVLSGAIGVGLGFGLQKVVSNLVSGIIILLDKSIKPGDVISLGDTFGWIEALGARYVSVVTRDGKEFLIPNEDLITGQVVNWSHSNDFVRLDLYFGTAYHDDPHTVREIAIKAALSVGRVLKDRKPVCHIVNFGNSSVDYILRFWIKDPRLGLTNIKGDVYLALWDAFSEHNISIPFPQTEVRLLPPEKVLSDK